jgi:hypothetical protein
MHGFPSSFALLNEFIKLRISFPASTGGIESSNFSASAFVNFTLGTQFSTRSFE